jgi:hypothetical protein
MRKRKSSNDMAEVSHFPKQDELWTVFGLGA